MIASVFSVITELFRSRIRFSQVAKNLACGIGAGRAHNAAARVRRGAAHVHALDRTAVLRITGKWPIEGQLIERQLALEDVAFGQS